MGQLSPQAAIIEASSHNQDPAPPKKKKKPKKGTGKLFVHMDKMKLDFLFHLSKKNSTLHKVRN